MNSAKPNCSPKPQSTVRHGKSRRLLDNSHASRIKATIPSRLMKRSMGAKSNRTPARGESFPAVAQFPPFEAAKYPFAEARSAVKLCGNNSPRMTL